MNRDAFAGTPAEGTGRTGERRQVWHSEDWCGNVIGEYGPCPYGVPGDRLRMLTTWAVSREWDKFRPSNLPDFNLRFWSLFDCTPKPEWTGKSRPGRFLPLSLRHRMPLAEVTGVRVERLQDITEEDARAEGVTPAPFCKSGRPARQEHVEAFESLWREINGAESWGANPWVWVVSFKRINAGHDH